MEPSWGLLERHWSRLEAQVAPSSVFSSFLGSDLSFLEFRVSEQSVRVCENSRETIDFEDKLEREQKFRSKTRARAEVSRQNSSESIGYEAKLEPQSPREHEFSRPWYEKYE